MTPDDGDRILNDRDTYSRIFDDLYDRYKSSVYRFAYYLSQNKEETDELFQETWLRVVQYSSKLSAVRDFKAWVYAITANIHRDILRKKRIRRMFFTQHAGKYDERSRNIKRSLGENNRLTMDESDRVDLGHAINRAITELPMRQRRVFVLKEVEGFKHAEIGKILGVPVGTVKSLLYRAIRHLRQELSAYDPEASS